MLEEQGIVVRVEGEVAEVEAQPRQGCGSCSARHGCGTSLVASLFPARSRRFRARNRAGARPGDRVVIGLDEGALQVASVLLYLFPLAGLIGGALLGDWLARLLGSGDGELLSVLLGAGGMALVFLLLRLGVAGGGRGSFQAVVLRVEPRPGSAVVKLEPGS